MPPNRLCHVAIFQAPDCLLYNAVKAHRPHNPNRVFTNSQKYVCNVDQITTLGGKFNIFLTRTRTKNAAQNIPKHAISSEKFNFLNIDLWEGDLASSQIRPPVWKGTPSPHTICRPHQAFWIARPSPQNSSRIYATGTDATTCRR